MSPEEKAERRAARAAAERQQRLEIQDINRREKERAELKRQNEEAQAKLTKRKRELMSLEGVLESRHALKRYTLRYSDKAKPAVAGLLREISDTMCWSASQA